MKIQPQHVPDMPARVPLSTAQCIGVFVRPIKQKGLNYWNLERISIIHVEPVTWARKVMGAVMRREVEPTAVLDWDEVEGLQYFLNEGQAISFARNMTAQRPNTHKRVVGNVIFGSNNVPEVGK